MKRRHFMVKETYTFGRYFILKDEVRSDVRLKPSHKEKEMD
jgi:hypothetical protein